MKRKILTWAPILLVLMAICLAIQPVRAAIGDIWSVNGFRIKSNYDVDSSGNINIASGKVYKINNIQATTAALSNYTMIGMLNENETVDSNWVNTAFPWADNEVANDLTISGGTVNNSIIGGSTPLAGYFTTLSSTQGVSVATATTQAYKAEYNVDAQLGAWVHGVKVELTRTANIQPATGGWYGAQFVLNAGSDGSYAVLNKPAYALAAIFKGDKTLASSAECNAARFETQSSGKVDDICYILANSGTTVEGSLLYLATHIAPGDSIACLNVQSSQTVGKAVRFTAGSGSTMTSLLYCDGDGTFTNLLEVSATGKGGVSIGAMYEDTLSDTPDGYITIKVGTTSYQVPFYAAS